MGDLNNNGQGQNLVSWEKQRETGSKNTKKWNEMIDKENLVCENRSTCRSERNR